MQPLDVQAILTTEVDQHLRLGRAVPCAFAFAQVTALLSETITVIGTAFVYTATTLYRHYMDGYPGQPIRGNGHTSWAAGGLLGALAAGEGH
ncbi:hypothetical protein OIU91_03510 [Streptomyces sp. NBC_01456]|uniref:hypothetical protein n=1 Tax=unclassified Streptomyces TaxID=2593676 RepID=UPI002E2F57B3|nr:MULTISPECIES: hypothetical protein [unclassified Streptomyces]